MVKKILLFVSLFLCLLAIPRDALATVAVAPATGGSAISVATVGGTYTSLTGPVISESVTADIGTGTVILNVPTGFVFDTGGTAPTVLVTRIGGTGPDPRNINNLPSGSTIAITVTTTQLTITITQASNNGVTNSLTWQNVRVRPSAATPLASGDIVKTGTSVISGVTNSVTNLGTLTEVAVLTPTPASVLPRTGTINVVKNVVNDSGGTKVVSDFSLFVNGTPVSPGVTATLPAPGPAFTVTETGSSGYTTTFSGDCDSNGQFNLLPGDNKFCIIINNDIGPATSVPPTPPLISLLIVPSPLALLAGPGSVSYAYILRNIGTVPMTDVTVVGNACSPIVLVLGDTNSNNILSVGETWTYACTRALTETHTNNVIATGWANGISAVDVANSKVVVGAPGLPDTGVVPPLIHVTKIPSPLTLPKEGGVGYLHL